MPFNISVSSAKICSALANASKPQNCLLSNAELYPINMGLIQSLDYVYMATDSAAKLKYNMMSVMKYIGICPYSGGLLAMKKIEVILSARCSFVRRHNEI